jgi:hypothetical protein
VRCILDLRGGGMSYDRIAKQLNADGVAGNRRANMLTIWGRPTSARTQKGLDGKADPAAGILSTRAGLELVRDFEGCSEIVQESASLLCKAAADALNSATGKKAK